MRTLQKRTSCTLFVIPDVKIEDYNVIIDGRICFHQPVNHKERKYYNIQKIVNYRGDDFTTSCLLDGHYFKDHQKIILIDLRKQQALDAAPKTIQ